MMEKEDLAVQLKAVIKGGGDYVSTPSTPDYSTMDYRHNHGLSSLGNGGHSHLGQSRLVILF